MTTAKKKKKAPPPPGPKPPFAETKIPGGLPKMFQIWEDMRARNANGYVPGGGLLANVGDHGALSITKGTTCSPFTATVVALMYDKDYPRDDLGEQGDADPYVAKFNGGNDTLPFRRWYNQHNTINQPIESIVEYNLGVEIDMKQMRRGDLLAIGWFNKNRGGHAVFCWDVHLNDKGEVDCFQYLGANSVPSLCGVTIGWCGGADFLKGKAKGTGTKGTLEPVNPPIFADSDKVVQKGQWLVLPGVPAGSIKPETFRVPPPIKNISYPKEGTFTVHKLRVGRFHYDGSPPEPYRAKDGGAAQTKLVGHVSAPPVVIKGPAAKKDTEAPKKIAPKPVVQEKARPLGWQLQVEQAMQAFYRAKWIEADPGIPDNINDEKSKAAIKEYQERLKLEVDGLVGKETLGSVQKQVPACLLTVVSQMLLAALHAGKKLDTDPGLADGTNHAKTRAAVEEFQKQQELPLTGVPDADTLAKLQEVVKGHEATPSKPGLQPAVEHLYWVGNTAEPGGKATLRLHCRDLIVDQECAIHLRDAAGGEGVEAGVKFKVSGPKAEASVVIPKEFAAGSRLHARVVAALEEEGELEANTRAPLLVRSPAGAATEAADWRPYAGKDAVPDEILEKIRRNRARHAPRNLFLVKGKYAGTNHFNYTPPKAHTKWANEYFQAKVDQAPPQLKLGERAFLLMLRSEGRPASFQTYDNQIITWGVGLGAKGNGKHAFENLNKDASMKRLLDDVGINFFNGSYHVVDLAAKKVISSTPGKAGNDNRHIVPLDAWRRQPDLMSAIIGISEDPATRELVAESQYAVHKGNSLGWKGQDKVLTLSLYFMIAHMYAWMPAIAKYGFDVDKEFAAIGGGTPSKETDKKLALRIARAFVKYAKEFFTVKQAKQATYDDIRTRTRTRLWKTMKDDGKAEGFDPGDLTYEDE